MNNYYEITPLDTLFFRGSTPMEAGQYNTVSLFPPPLSVIKGAFWTKYCKLNDKSFSDGLINNEIPIEVTGIFIKKYDELYVPCPSTWYYDYEKKVLSGKNLNNVPICKAENKSEIFKRMGISTSAGDVVFVKPNEDAKPLTGCWISITALNNKIQILSENDILFPSDIYSMESRTGNALDENKITVEGALYTSTHVRLEQDISIVVSLESELDLESGKFYFGGEKRLSEYKKLTNIPKFEYSDSNQFLSLSPIKASEENLTSLISSGKLVTVSGWDLNKGFHKPSSTYIPAGAVFTKKINNSCIPLV